MSISYMSVRVSSNILLTPKKSFFYLYFVIFSIIFISFSSFLCWVFLFIEDFSFSILSETMEGMFRSLFWQNYFIYAIILSTWWRGNMLQIISRNFLELLINYVFVNYFLKDFTFKGTKSRLVPGLFWANSFLPY